MTANISLKSVKLRGSAQPKREGIGVSAIAEKSPQPNIPPKNLRAKMFIHFRIPALQLNKLMKKTNTLRAPFRFEKLSPKKYPRITTCLQGIN